MFDFIGDIHGHLKPLIALLERLGYKEQDGIYFHPSRQAFFLGDFIDRGPDSAGVVRLVRRMVEANQALAIMGNHEWNAIQYHTASISGQFLRPRSAKNRKQHIRTLESYECEEDSISPALANDLRWFHSLPLFHEGQGFRAVHATWNENEIAALKKSFPDGIVNSSFVARAAEKESDEYRITDVLLKGQEMDLPESLHFQDKDGNRRTSARIKWWKNSPTLDNPSSGSAEEFLFLPAAQTWQPESLPFHSFPGYSISEAPVFFGHYWKQFPPSLEARNVCCLDYSVARNGHLMAYRWDGEQSLSEEKFHYTRP